MIHELLNNKLLTTRSVSQVIYSHIQRVTTPLPAVTGIKGETIDWGVKNTIFDNFLLQFTNLYIIGLLLHRYCLYYVFLVYSNKDINRVFRKSSPCLCMKKAFQGQNWCNKTISPALQVIQTVYPGQ